MRRKDREITDRAMISGMLDMTEVLHIAVKNEPFPYIVPVNFGYEWRADELVFLFPQRQRRPEAYSAAR